MCMSRYERLEVSDVEDGLDVYLRMFGIGIQDLSILRVEPD